jgi:hypothetical protein
MGYPMDYCRIYRAAKTNSPYFHFDCWIRGHRFFGTTKCPTRREAEKVETAEREKAKLLVRLLQKNGGVHLEKKSGRAKRETSPRLRPFSGSGGLLRTLCLVARHRTRVVARHRGSDPFRFLGIARCDPVRNGCDSDVNAERDGAS